LNFQVSEEQYNKVLSYIESGKQEGAKLEAGGSKVGGTGYYVYPTVFSNVTDNMKIAREEVNIQFYISTDFNDFSEYMIFFFIIIKKESIEDRTIGFNDIILSTNVPTIMFTILSTSYKKDNVLVIFYFFRYLDQFSRLLNSKL